MDSAKCGMAAVAPVDARGMSILFGTGSLEQCQEIGETPARSARIVPILKLNDNYFYEVFAVT
jgi:hypothetical protein